MSSGHHLLHAENLQALFKALDGKTTAVTTEGSERHLCHIVGSGRACSPDPRGPRGLVPGSRPICAPTALTRYNTLYT